ncbi:MAG TPA: Asp-tRNA(Asn)/Glu-tRNA(Gln) amidotransferase subunit GatC [Candidatus Faeciplasma gallinarum]|uniref:Aspartyl/glutamyl-tRNA(Asn/Gln) amidotransferase subunit C n=1 Tax=Candidatus Faeciplasma gallinarum TaxID=2840799 RepID=A0A9D1EQC1_9FIRM|nr:Asp-tRNA(Asn)/Glu-tRNA(Gln) amidotransferase subunit GatC [Candidatus Faeciplasma gallinarum]
MNTNASDVNIDLKHIAKLARLRIDDSELKRYESEMTDIINMVNSLPEINEELCLDPDQAMILREDKLSDDKISRDEMLSNAPKVVAGCVVVPKIVD